MFDCVPLLWSFPYCSIVSSFRMTKISTSLYAGDCQLCESPQTVVVAVISFQQAQQWKKKLLGTVI